MDVLKPKTESERLVKREASGDYLEDKNGYLENDKKKKGMGCVGGGGGSGKKGSGGGGGGGGMRCCQAEKCTAELSDAKPYHRRHKVCEYHAKAQVVIVGGTRQRFCQQCSRFHELGEFDETKRSCRRRLAGHNERRRKSSVCESQAEGSSGKGSGGSEVKDMVDDRDRGRIQMTLQENASYKHFQIR